MRYFYLNIFELQTKYATIYTLYVSAYNYKFSERKYFEESEPHSSFPFVVSPTSTWVLGWATALLHFEEFMSCFVCYREILVSSILLCALLDKL